MSNVIEFEAFRKLRKIISPKEYAEITQRAMKNKDKWVDRPMYDTNIVVARAFKNKGSWKNG